MEELYPWSSPLTVERALGQVTETEAREWLADHWDNEFLSADEAVLKRLLPLIDLPRCGNRAATVLRAIDFDWAWMLDAANDPACGFTSAFWRNAFGRAREAGSARCMAWMLDAKQAEIGRIDTWLEL